MKSSRLKNKLTLKIQDREIIRLLIDRIKLSPSIDQIIMATPFTYEDKYLEKVAEEEGIGHYSGFNIDVLERMLHASRKYDLDYICCVPADNPLVSYDYIPKILEVYEKTDADLVTTNDLPEGLYLFGIKVESLEEAIKNKKGHDHGYIEPYFEDMHVEEVEVPEEYKNKKYHIEIDYLHDYHMLLKLYDMLGTDTYKISTKELIEFMDNHREVWRINEYCTFLREYRWKTGL